MKTRTSHLALSALLGVTALLLSGCSGAASSAQASGGAITVVASTNVYGDLARSIGGDLIEVTSIIDSPDKDPHEYQATARDQLAVSAAALVIKNGGGYDTFIDTMLAAAKPPVVTATVVAGLEDEHSGASHSGASHPDFNEHVWYDLGVVRNVVIAIRDRLSSIDVGHAASYAAKAETLTGGIDRLIAREQQLKGALSGHSIAITEPVPLYLTEALGLSNSTPEAFSQAVEEGTDVPATTLQETLALFSDKKVGALVYNSQTEGAQTNSVLAAAKAAGVPTVAVTETLPDGDDYVSWMTATLDALEGALSR